MSLQFMLSIISVRRWGLVVLTLMPCFTCGENRDFWAGIKGHPCHCDTGLTPHNVSSWIPVMMPPMPCIVVWCLVIPWIAWYLKARVVVPALDLDNFGFCFSVACGSFCTVFLSQPSQTNVNVAAPDVISAVVLAA